MQLPQLRHRLARLLDVLHLRAAYGDRPADVAGVVQFLVIERTNPGSILASIARARENTRSVRDLVSKELWEAVNDLHLALTSRDLRQELANQPFEPLALVRRACMAIYGTAAETLGLAYEDVDITRPDTDVQPHALGALASRLTYVAGNAVKNAAAAAAAAARSSSSGCRRFPVFLRGR